MLNPFSRIKIQDKINLARHLHITIKSGLPLAEAVDLIRRQTTSKFMRGLLNVIAEDLSKGKLLAESLEARKKYFGDFFISIVRVGEASGNLPENLLYLSRELEKQKELRGKIRAALIYPVIILVATIGITAFLVFGVLPKILPIFLDLKVELPLPTRILMATVNLFTDYGWLIAGGIIAFVIVVKQILRIKSVHFLFDRFLLVLPLVKTLLRYITLVSFTRSLWLLLKSGMTIVDALRISAGTFHNAYYRKEIQRAAEGVRQGDQISRSFAAHPKAFPPMFTNMVQIGENTGNLEENLVYLSEYYEEEIEVRIKNLTAVLEPVLLLFMGFLVGFVALSIIIPIYQLTQAPSNF